MNVGSLFSGIGGIELGLHRAGGFETKWLVEREPYAQAVLRKRFPTARIYDDVTTVEWSTVEPVDVLTGGFPCQDISVSNVKGVGITGTRSGLWKSYLEAIRILRPRYIIAENSPNLRNKGLNAVLADLASIGYDAEWRTLRASQFGAKHKRARLYIVAYPCGTRRLCERTWETFVFGVSRIEQANQFAEASQRVGRQWASEPNVGRVADGVSRRMDRIRCLGNAVVPQVAQFLGERIKQTEEKYATTD